MGKNVQDLFPFAIFLLVLGMVLGLGVLIVDVFGNQASAINTVVEENVTFTARVGTTTFDEVLTVTSLFNGSENAIGFTFVQNTGKITLNSSALATDNYVANYTYRHDSPTAIATDAARDEISGIATNWLAMILIIVIAAIILGIVIVNLGRRR